MQVDPIIEELHAIRRKLAAECGNDLHKIVLRAAQRQKQAKHLQAVQPQPPTTQMPEQNQQKLPPA
jgi:hypothetical protein